VRERQGKDGRKVEDALGVATGRLGRELETLTDRQVGQLVLNAVWDWLPIAKPRVRDLGGGD
jgi:hypothetical protein